jgi:branched-chain amino acid transport system ATP-binding protein
MSQEMLATRGLSASYGSVEILSDVDIDVSKGEVVCVIGHNGAGKSTLLRVLFGLHAPSRGEIRLRGAAMRPAPALMTRSGVAYVPDGRGVFPELTVREIFRLSFWSIGVRGGEAQERIDEVLAVLPRIGDFWKRRAGSLSGGQQQMVSIGRGLLSRPSILLLDEPSIGLAPKLFQDLMDPLRVLQQQRRMSIVLVEQNLDEAFAVSDRVVVIKSGRVIRKALPADFADRTLLMDLF